MYKRNLISYFILFYIVSCNDAKQVDLIGVWYNKTENCKIILLSDSTFNAVNLPLDVENSYRVIKKDKTTYSGNGFWSIDDDDNVKLSFGKAEWYTLEIVNSKKLSVQLTDEGGGGVILFERIK